MINFNIPAISITGGNFFPYALAWLLTFAIVYGILQHYKIPTSKSARGVISIVFAFFVMPVAGPVVGFLQTIGASLIVVATGIIFFLILIELTKTRHLKLREEEGEVRPEATRIISAHSASFAAIVIIIAIIIFWGAGGFELIGLERIIPTLNLPVLFFLGILALAIWWITSEE